MQTKAILRFHLTPVTMAIIQKQMTNINKEVGKKGSLYNVGGNVNWYNHYGRKYEGSSKN
jgi:hypothetical protein